MKKIVSFFSVVIMILLLQSCYYDELPSTYGPPTDVSFNQDVQTIFNINCVSCHNGGEIPLNLTSGNAFDELTSGGYVIPSDADNSLLVQSLRGDGMAIMPPSGSLPTRDINEVVQWINEGALDN